MPPLKPRPVLSGQDVEQMRLIRNACRDGFAHDTGEIGPDRQRHWWLANRGKLVAYLYDDDSGAEVGYGLLRQTEDGRWWSSVAVLDEHTGQGYGKEITRHLIRQAPDGVVHAEARKDNPAADKLHDRRDWDVVGEDDRLWHYQTKAELPNL